MAPRAPRFANPVDYLARRQLRVIEGHAHDAANEGSPCAPHALNFLRLAFELESTGFTSTAIQAHHASVETSLDLRRQLRSDLAD